MRSLKTLHFLMVAALFLPLTSSVEAREPSAARKTKKTTAKKSAPAAKSTSTSSGGADSDLRQALAMAKQGQYQEASVKLFQLSVSPRYSDKRMQIRYLLGLMLYQLKLYQLSAFQFIGVVRDGSSQYVSPALEKLSLAANELGDDTLLNYAISRVKTESFPAVHRDMLFYRIGEFQQRSSQFNDAIRSFDQVPKDSPLFEKAMYMKGLAQSQSGQVDDAIITFTGLYEWKRSAPVTDTTRVAALMGQARALYQKKDWEGAIQAYREVPRDTELWHDTIFESSWAMLRSGRFRSAISNFQSLHSPYYEESYIPESLLLRSIVYLYICQYDEMDKVLTLFTKIYKPVFKNMTDYLKSVKNPVQYFNDVVTTLQTAEKIGVDAAKTRTTIPYVITQKVAQEGDFQRTYQYIKKLIEERRRVRALPAAWRSTGLGKYSLQTLDRRIQKARAKGGRQIRAHMLAARTELIDLFEQEGFIRYEMINGKKEQIKKRVAGKDLPTSSIDEDNSRDYYIQNGYEYWPFRGEYWLDELGNYHYLGTRSCE